MEVQSAKKQRLEFENRKQEIMIKMLKKENEAKRVAVAELANLEEGLDGGGVEVEDEGVELEEAEEVREEEEEDEGVEEDGSIYCLCQQVAYGKMVACDNQDCPLAWFHFGCVGLQSSPRGKWYCPQCKPS